MGNGNMLHVANMALHIGHMTGRDEIPYGVQMVTEGGARTLNLQEEYGIEEGKPASFIVVDGQDSWELMRRMPVTRFVVFHGKIIASTHPAKAELHIGEHIEPVIYTQPSF
jgi:cytosine deaminase